MQENRSYFEEFTVVFKSNLNKSNYITINKDRKNSIETTKVNVKTKKISQFLNKEKGINYSVKCDIFNIYENTSYIVIAKKICKILKELSKPFSLKKDFSVLVVGLGNSEVTADSLGTKVVNKLIVSSEDNNVGKFCFRNVFAICPSVFAKTGILTADTVLSIVRLKKPDLVIVVDSLSCKNHNLLNKSFQINNVGLKPGGEISTITKWINKSYLKTNIVAIGVPLVTNFTDIMAKNDAYSFFCDKDIDFITNKWAYILALGINIFLQDKFSLEDILFYMS